MKGVGYKVYLIAFAIIFTGGLGILVAAKINISWLSIVIAAVSLIILLVGLQFVSNIADTQLADYYRNKKQDPVQYRYQPSDKLQFIIYNFLGITVTAMIICIKISGGKVEKYLQWKNFIIDVLVIGGVLAFVTCRLYLNRFKIKLDKHEREDH